MTAVSETILIVLNGGLVQAVCYADGMEVPNAVIVDYDVEGASPDEVTTTVHGDEAYVHTAWTTPDTALVEWVDTHMDQDDVCPHCGDIGAMTDHPDGESGQCATCMERS